MRVLSVLLASGLILVSCGKKSKDDSGPKISVSKASDLKLSKAAKPSFPKSVTGKGSRSLTLAGKLSYEACQLRSTMRTSFSVLNALAELFTAIEAAGDKISFEQLPAKYTVVEGQDKYGLYFAQNGEGLRVVVCSKSTPMMEIDVDGANGTTTSGNSKFAFSEGGLTASFNSLFTTSGNDGSIETKMSYNLSSGSSSTTIDGKFYTSLTMTSDLVTVKAAESGTFLGASVEERGAAKLNDKFGMIFFQEKKSSTKSYTSYFDAAGYEVASTASADFAGTLKVTATDLPEFLGASFSPDKIVSTSEVCSGGTELTITAPEDGDSTDEFTEEDCNSSAYEQGDET